MKKFTDILKKNSLKDYDFTIEKSKLESFEGISIAIDNLKTRLNLLDKAVNITLKGHSIEETLKYIFENNYFKENINFQRIGFAHVDNKKDTMALALSEKRTLFETWR